MITSIDSVKSLSAVDKLRDLLTQIDRSGSLSPRNDQSSSPKSSKDTTTPKDFHQFVQTTEELIHVLNEENTALRDDNVKIRSNVVALIEENNRLYEEIRSTFVTDMLRLINMDDGRPTTDKESQIVDLYSRKMRSLEVELKNTKEQLNMYETIWQPSNDLMNCPKCGAVLPFASHGSEHRGKFADLIAENEVNKHKLQQIQIRLEQTQAKEQETLTRFQTSLAIVEQNQFDRADAIIERDQTKIELAETQKRLQTFLNEMDTKITNEKQNIELISQQRLSENIAQIKQLEDRCAQYELIIDRLSREKTSLAADCDIWKERIQRQEMDLSQATDSVKLQIQKAVRERDQANQNAMQSRSNFEKLLSQSSQDSLQLRQQFSSMQTRLNDIENELFQSKKQCLDLTEEINGLTRENLMLKSTKQTLERSREENIDAIVVILNKREADYRTTIENLELERHQSLAYLEELVSHQNQLLTKLRVYSWQLTEEMEIILAQKHETTQEINVKNQELQMKLSDAYERLEETNTQLLQHTDIHLKLKERIIQLNNQLKQYEQREKK